MHFDLLHLIKKLFLILIFALLRPSSLRPPFAARSAIVIASRNNATSVYSIDNAVVGEPRLECGAGFIMLRFRTRAHFMGRIFVKGMASVGYSKAARRSCEVRASDACVPLRASRYSAFTNETSTTMDSHLHNRSRGHHALSKYAATRRAVENHSNKNLLLERISDSKNQQERRHRVSRREAAAANDATGGDACAMRVLFDGDSRGGCTPLTRQRSLNPRGVAVTATIVVSFHPLFITQIDRMYRLQCFYRNQGGGGPDLATMAMVKADFHVNGAASSLNGPTASTPSLSMPICRYEVLDNGPDGQHVMYASLRARLYHRWSCATADASAFCFRVHSCYARAAAEDGRGRAVILDKDGCAVDRLLLDNLSYAANETSLTAGQFAPVYKYADEESLYFQCQIRVWRRKSRGAKCWVENCPEPKPFGSFTSNELAVAKGSQNYIASSARRRIRRLTASEEESLKQFIKRSWDNSDETDEQYGGDVDVSAEIRVIEDLEQF